VIPPRLKSGCVNGAEGQSRLNCGLEI
jgi:hypothetical protein